MKKLSVLVEGPTDKQFFGYLAPWFNQNGFVLKVLSAKDRGRLLRDAEKHVSVARDEGADVILLNLDQDEDHCPPTTAGRLAHVRATDVVISVASRCLEAWMLADSAALRNVTGIPFNPSGFTDDILDPSSAIRQLFRSAVGESLSKVEITSRVGPEFNIERAQTRNRSLARLIERIQARA